MIYKTCGETYTFLSLMGETKANRTQDPEAVCPALLPHFTPAAQVSHSYNQCLFTLGNSTMARTRLRCKTMMPDAGHCTASPAGPSLAAVSINRILTDDITQSWVAARAARMGLEWLESQLCTGTMKQTGAAHREGTEHTGTAACT